MNHEPITAEQIGKAYSLLGILPYAKPLDGPIVVALVSTFRAAGVGGDELLEAASWAAQTQQTWPPPATLIGRVRDNRERALTGSVETAEEAWGKVISAMQGGWHDQNGRIGPFPARMSARSCAAFVSAFGPSWAAFWGQALSDDMVSHRSRYVDAYRSSSALDRQLLEHERVKRETVNPQVARLWEQRLKASAQRPTITDDAGCEPGREG